MRRSPERLEQRFACNPIPRDLGPGVAAVNLDVDRIVARFDTLAFAITDLTVDCLAEADVSRGIPQLVVDGLLVDLVDLRVDLCGLADATDHERRHQRGGRVLSPFSHGTAACTMRAET